MANPVPHVKWKETMPAWLRKRNRASRRSLVSETIRPFLRGENVELNNYALDLIGRFIRLKEMRAVKANPAALDFTKTEQRAIRNGFFWLLHGMKPELSAREALKVAGENMEKCRKINAGDIRQFMDSKQEELEKNKHADKKSLYGQAGMFMDAINHANGAAPPPSRVRTLSWIGIP